MTEFDALAPAPEPVDAGAALLALVRYAAHIDAVIFEQAGIRKYVSEGGQTILNATSLDWNPQTTNPIKVTALVLSVSAPATLTLGDISMPIPAGLSVLPGLALLLRGQVKRNLSLNAGALGTLFVLLMGEEYPTHSYSSGAIGG